eukprot:TRINITY_DN34115_c0_g1_i1.p1 TRINITY_DN34115_c0_g1~~TRINITY_DN34115_c0_g1_i1.p1  ORF type:complete len:140 (+),score=48.60 TRINITY_DN34115_c0_g1_i1:96-515(+)
MVFFCVFCFFFFSSRRRHTRCREVSWARRCVQETDKKSIQNEVQNSASWEFENVHQVFHALSQRKSPLELLKRQMENQEARFLREEGDNTRCKNCLLYTSDAADDTPCVDLGGRRIIKKKKIKILIIKQMNLTKYTINK